MAEKSTKTKVAVKNKKLPIIVFVLLFAAVGAFFVINSFASTPTSSKIYLSASTYSVSANTTFEVQIRENSGTVAVNTVQANISYPANLVDLVSIDATNTSFGVQAQSTGANGAILVARGSYTPRTGDQLVATLHFKSKTVSGNASLAFTTGTALISSDTNTAITGPYSTSGTGAATIAISGTTTTTPSDTTPPTAPTGLTGTAQSGGYITLTWNSSTDNVKVTNYKVKLTGFGTVANVPGKTVILNSATPGKTYTYNVYAQDAAGNLSAPSASFSIVAK